MQIPPFPTIAEQSRQFFPASVNISHTHDERRILTSLKQSLKYVCGPLIFNDNELAHVQPASGRRAGEDVGSRPHQHVVVGGMPLDTGRTQLTGAVGPVNTTIEKGNALANPGHGLYY